jgi:hypothetical protein
MTHPPIPPAVTDFLAEHVDSVSTLDTLLLVRGGLERTWTPGEVARVLVTSEMLATSQLDHLLRHGLVQRERGGYAYTRAGAHAGVVDVLADCYARRRHTVIGLIYRPAV